jgi:hypothetical protein
MSETQQIVRLSGCQQANRIDEREHSLMRHLVCDCGF